MDEPEETTELRDTTVGDADVALGAIVKFTLGLVAVTLVVLVLMWLLSSHFKSALERSDPVPPAIVAENPPEAAPGPRLQSDPDRDMAELRAEENAALESYAWLTPEKTVARIPISRAMEIVLANGLPKGTGGAGPAAQEPRAPDAPALQPPAGATR